MNSMIDSPVFSAYEAAEHSGAGQVLPYPGRAVRTNNERYRLLLSLMMTLLIHVLAFLSLLVFAPLPQFDEPPRVLSVVPKR